MILTDQEIDTIWPAPPGTNSMLVYARAIEAALLKAREALTALRDMITTATPCVDTMSKANAAIAQIDAALGRAG